MRGNVESALAARRMMCHVEVDQAFCLPQVGYSSTRGVIVGVVRGLDYVALK